MWLIPCQDGDQEAVWIGEQLRALGLEPLELVSASELVHRARWEHRVGALGSFTTLRLADGRRIDSGDVRGVLNRLVWCGADGFLGASAEDREYASAELSALVLSWLAGFGARVLNPPAPPALGVPWCSSCEWRARALAVGTRIRPYATDAGPEPGGDASLLVIDGAAVGDQPPALAGADPARLRLATGLDVFEASFATAADGGWELLDINPMVAFSAAAGGVAPALAAALRTRSDRGAGPA